MDEAQTPANLRGNALKCLHHTRRSFASPTLNSKSSITCPALGPERIEAIRAALNPLEVDLGTQNHRSPDSEILIFANDILAGQARGASYKGVSSFPIGQRTQHQTGTMFYGVL